MMTRYTQSISMENYGNWPPGIHEKGIRNIAAVESIDLRSASRKTEQNELNSKSKITTGDGVHQDLCRWMTAAGDSCGTNANRVPRAQGSSRSQRYRGVQ